MSIATSPDRFLSLTRLHPVIDVRSPGEYSRGHIPGALNVPLLDDAERAEVGATYKLQGRKTAVSLGMRIVRPKIPQLLKSVYAISPTPDVLVHCWRGGMRSEGVARLLQTDGFRPRTLSGGYKAFRQMARRSFSEPRRIVILSGFSGSGKTHLLQALRAQGEQVIDLEGLACHRGSAFGGIGQPPQPTTEQFENGLFNQWRSLDPSRVVWIESESKVIGSVAIPQPIYQQVLSAPVVCLQVHREARIDRLVSDYGDLPADELELALGRIKKRLGGDRYNRALGALSSGNWHALADIVLDYYDKAYKRSRQDVSWALVHQFPMSSPLCNEQLSALRRVPETF